MVIAKYGGYTCANQNILIYQEKIIVDKRSKMMYNDDIKQTGVRPDGWTGISEATWEAGKEAYKR